jgi:hypothetical protein
MSELQTFDDRMVTNYIPQIVRSAENRNLAIRWALRSQVSQSTGRQYLKKTIVAVEDGQAVLQARCNRRGAVHWDQIWPNNRQHYKLAEAVQEVQ